MEIQINNLQQMNFVESRPRGVKNVTSGAVRTNNKAELIETGHENSAGAGQISATLQDLQGALEEIQNSLDLMQTRISFRIDSESNEGILQVIERNSGKVLSQIPPEEILKLRAVFKEFVRGIFLDAKA